jgi:Subtilisin inhibitor-like
MGRSSSEGEGTGDEAGTTSLEISVTPGTEAPTQIWTLRCPDGGTLPGAAEACDQLERVDDPFAPVPENVACTEIYGGPQTADVRGTYQGRPVEARFNRTNGCEIARWDNVQFLFAN